SPIPVQPMSYRDASRILERLKGPVPPGDWRGSLPMTYHAGPGPAKVHMRLQMDYGQRRLVNVVGRLTGAAAPDEWIIVGSHRDAWVFGASDSVSGHVSMMAAARAFGALAKNGWRPRRSILFVSWDGEEPGLLGSTEWVEDLAADLKAHAAVYLNRDAGAGGPTFNGSAVHSLQPFLYELAKSIPTGSRTLYDTWLARTREQAVRDRSAEASRSPETPEVGALGSGSDYTAFLDHIGVASADIGLTGIGGDGTYHSTYDHPGWFKRYIDPEFKYSILATQATGVAVMRLADAELLPLDYVSYGQQILDYINEIENEAWKKSPEKAGAVGFADLTAAATEFTKAGARLRARGNALLARPADAAALAAIDRRLVAAERDLIEPAGLPDRPWFKHVIYAPGLYTGYGVKTIPGVREAVDAGNFARAAEQAQVVIRALRRATKTLE
ncbi:MAG TPA: transferrin receptor-like dimerization domain-containing protein, partial [Vicinamibacterales bacterium]|nr:transferrin receptor-like dimerization domain-containing protein [Vicinamibacterales bacterium]